MENKNTNQIEETEHKVVGGKTYLNKNCWLVKNLNYSPYKRCQYCDFKFHNCLFLHYQVISMTLIVFCLSLFWIFDKRISTVSIIVVFILVIVYGYFFNNSTEKIVKSMFFEKKTKEALRRLSGNLEERVNKQTGDIKEKNQHLEELLNMKSDFLRTVNHQLNTPLSIMKNSFAMMDDGSLPIDQGIQIASSGLERMSSTISEFWDAFELEGQKVQMKLVETDIEKIVNDLIIEKQNIKLVSTRGLNIKFKKPRFSIPKVLCDHKKIIHVASNLLDNAIFYTQKGSIEVGFEKVKKSGKDFLKILVTDTGAGISPEDQKRLFVKFSRGSQATSLHPDGSGLGLYIAKNVVEDSGGELKLEKSEVGKGTTFSFILKVAEASEIEKVDEVKASEIAKKEEDKEKKYSILMVEDEQSIIDLYKIYFENHGHKFFSTYDLVEAKKIAKDKKINAIILDIIIRKQEKDGMINVVAEQGYTFMENMKKDAKLSKIPIIAFTSLNTDQDRNKAKKLGASEYLFKGSAKPQDLLDAIKKVVKK